MGVFKMVRGKHRKVISLVRWALVILLIVAIPVIAQVPVGTILGVVKDSSGGVVPQAKVTAVNVDTNETRTATTGDDGAFRLPAVPTGHYTVKFEKEGFKTETETGFTLDVATELVINPVLQVGSAAQEVTVTGEAPLVNTTTSALGGLVNEEKMADLPLNGRNYIDLTMLQPGITQNYNMGTAGGVAGSFYSSNGAPILGNNINIDGALMVTTQGGSTSSISGTTLGVDGIKEYKVITTAFSAEYGMTFGSQTNIVSKGGTNQWHGDAFDYLRNSAMDAANFFDTPQGSGGRRLPEFRRNNFGASGGGPIKKDNTFFYLVYEGLRQHLGFTALDSVLPAACVVQATMFTANPCAGTPAGTAAPVSLAVQPLLQIYANELNNSGSYITPAASQNTACALTTSIKCPLWSFPSSAVNSVNFGQMRIDHNLGANDSIFGRWTIDDDVDNVPSVQNAGANLPNGVAFPDFYTSEYSRNQYVTIAENHIFSPTLLNSLHASYTRTDTWLETLVNGPNNALTGGESGNPSVSTVPGFPVTQWTFGSNLSAWGTGGNNGPPATRPIQNIYTVSEDIFWVHGKHSFKIGTLINRYNESLQASNNWGGTAAAASGEAWLNGQLNALSAKPPPEEIERDFLFNTYGFYIQDDWRATPRLTLNLGFRYEFFSTPHELFNRENSWIVNDDVNGTRITEQTALPGPIIENRSNKNFSPRVGFAYDVFGNGKTAFHGAFGIYGEVGILGGTIRHDILSDPPYSAEYAEPLTGGIFQLPNCGAGTCTTYSNGFQYNGLGGQAIPFPALPAGVVQGSLASFEAGTEGNTLDVADYALQGEPHVAQWNFTVDQQLPGGFALTVSYVGTRGLQLFQENEGNAVWPCTSLTVSSQFPTGVCTGAGPANIQTNPVTGQPSQLYWNPAIFTNTNENQGIPQAVSPTTGAFISPNLRMNPYWGATTYNSTRGDSWYNGAQVNLTRRLSRGLQMQVAYTYSKVLDTGQGNLSGVDCSSSGGDHGNMPLDQAVDRGHACFDVTNNFHLNLLYNFPNLKTTAWYSKLTNGWWMGNIISVQSGYYFTPVLGGSTRSLAGTGGDRADLNTAAMIASYCPVAGQSTSSAAASTTTGSPTFCSYNPIPFNAATVITGNPAQWYNPNMFSVGPVGFFGDAGRDQLRGPGLEAWNFSITKDTHLGFLGEAGNLQFRAEIFNLLNHPDFPTPNGTVFTNGTQAASGLGSAAPFGISPGGTAGQITTTVVNSRQVQLALKILF